MEFHIAGDKDMRMVVDECGHKDVPVYVEFSKEDVQELLGEFKRYEERGGVGRLMVMREVLFGDFNVESWHSTPAVLLLKTKAITKDI